MPSTSASPVSSQRCPSSQSSSPSQGSRQRGGSAPSASKSTQVPSPPLAQVVSSSGVQPTVEQVPLVSDWSGKHCEFLSQSPKVAQGSPSVASRSPGRQTFMSTGDVPKGRVLHANVS